MNLKNKCVLVTGGAGFIGSHLVDRIIKEGPEKIIIIDNLFLGKMENLKEAKKSFKNILFHKNDASDLNFMKNVIKGDGVDVVFDLAVKPLLYSFVDVFDVYLTSVNIAQCLVSLLKDDLYKTLVHFSSSEAYGTAEYVPIDENHPIKPHTPYAAGKASADLLIFSYYKTFGIDVSIVRPFNTYGPRQNDHSYAAIIPLTIKKIMNKEMPILEWDGNQTRDFIFVEEVVNATVDIYNNKNTRGKAMNIASGKETRIKDIIELIIKDMGYKGKIMKKPKRLGDVRRHVGGIELVSNIVGFEPKIPLEEGIKRTVDWFLNNAYENKE